MLTDDMADSAQRFQVIIAGGSLVGLTTALALEKAGISYVLLEKREIAPHLGASISIHPHTQRVMEQLGVWPEIRAGVLPLENRQHYDENGVLFEDSSILQEISKQCHGRCTAFMERKFWLSCIYNTIKDKSRVRTNSGVASFAESAEGVEVTTESGEILKGDILLGADGVHSHVRNLLAEKLDSTDAAAAQKMRECYVSTYHAIFATSRNMNAKGELFLPERMVHNVYYPGFSGVSAAGVRDLVFWFLFVKSDQVTKTPNTPRFTEEQTLATIEKYGDRNLGPGYTFKDLWDTRVKANMVALEEGVLQTKWNSGGRVVLLGDAVHKATVNPGLGGNLAVEGVVHLMNELVPLLRKCEEDGMRKPTTTELAATFDEYEKKQRPHADLIVNASGYITRYEAMDTWWLNALRRVSPWVSDSMKASGFARYINEGPWLNFLPTQDEQLGAGEGGL
ncbi:FAD-dependent monooxygenase paxM [Colletotrichum sp. SAR 10_86]|nr:FAD-dependent monooxygenase paxM [Colletotrichum sp. SAR 10_75]KAI8231766.1 FAD-dependent monooxygenase paxM [Colletotrichum sp. SAR 10_86]KAI8264746.1 FAD-dependent monooxygenase paxM [Colletotrichum sp. SAR 10_77]